MTGNGDFPRISKPEIQDKSKGDAISKGFVILQTGWFVTQCIARGVQGLPITELELAAVAFAALNFVIYLLWWDKPLNVQRGVRVYKKRPTEELMNDGDVEATMGFWAALRNAFSDLPATILRGPLVDDDDIDRIIWLGRVLAWPVMRPLTILIGQDRERESEKRVGTFYPRQPEWVRSSLREGLFMSAIASAFGAIHCIGWSFTFPSSTEQTRWRVASVSIFVVPIIFIPTLFASTKVSNVYVGATMFMIVAYEVLLYILCRLALLVLLILCLRSLPPAAYHVVHWTSLIPHV